MIIKISVSELRGLMASGSAPSMRGALQVASHAGDGKTKQFVSTGRAFRAGSDHDVDRVGACCPSPVYADVPPMPEGFMGGFPHGCPAAAFARGFTEAFRPWLDAFDGVCRETVADRFEDGRALCMEAYAKSGSAAYVRFSVHDGCSADGRRTVLGFCTYVPGWADVRQLVMREVDGAVRSLAGALGLDDGRMARVRALAALCGAGPQSCGSRGTDGTQETRDETGRTADEKVDEKVENADEGVAEESGNGKGRETEGKVGLFVAALWERLDVMVDSVNGLLGLLNRTRSLVASTVRGGDGDGHIDVLVQVRDEKEDWVRSYRRSVGAGEADMDVDGRRALADSVAQGWTLVVMRAVVCDDWTGWSERRPDGKCVRCDGSRRAETKDYEARDEEDAEESRREMAEAERGMAEDLGVRSARVRMDGRSGDEADVQDYDIDDDRYVEGVGGDGGDEGEKTEPVRRIRRG